MWAKENRMDLFPNSKGFLVQLVLQIQHLGIVVKNTLFSTTLRKVKFSLKKKKKGGGTMSHENQKL